MSTSKIVMRGSCKYCGKAMYALNGGAWFHTESRMQLCDESSPSGNEGMRVQKWGEPVDRGIAVIKNERGQDNVPNALVTCDEHKAVGVSEACYLL